jgi:hypothetical protein
MKVRSEEDGSPDPPNSLTNNTIQHPRPRPINPITTLEDLEHFARHKAIEREEARREAKYQGITVEEALAQHDPDAEPKKPKAMVTPPEEQEPEIGYGGAKEESKNKAE